MSETPRPDAGSDDSNETPQPQIVVDDPEDFAKTRQLRAIFDARDDYIAARREANEAHDQKGGLSLSRMNAHIFRHLQDFAMAAEPLLMSNDDGQELWNDKTYSVEEVVCDAASLASVQDGLNLLQKTAEKVIEGRVTHQNLGVLANQFNIELSQSDRETVIDIVQQMGQQQQTSSTPQIRAQSIDDISEIDVKQLQAAVTQSQQQQTQIPSASASDVVRAIRRIKNGERFGGYNTSIHAKKLEFKLRIQATDWGWQTTGINSLVSKVPKLRYPTSSGYEFKKTSPPQSLSNDVFRDIQLFLDDVGLGISFDETQQTKIDDDLLDEVEDWRSTNT